MKKKNERAVGVKRGSRSKDISAPQGKGETLADRLELIVDQILDGATTSDRTSNLGTAAGAFSNFRPTGRRMSEDEINSLMERMIFSENSFNGYTH